MAPVRTIALEEHFWTPELAAPPGTGPLAMWGPRVAGQLRDLGQVRLADMDANGIDLQVISHVAPAAQGRAVIYVTLMLPKVCADPMIYGTMVL